MKRDGILHFAFLALLALEGWTLSEIVQLKVEVAQISIRLNIKNTASVTHQADNIAIK